MTDNIQRNKMTVEYCPKLDMVGDYFTKPLQWSLFRKMRSIIMNLEDVVLENTAPGNTNNGHSTEAQECAVAAPTLSIAGDAVV